MANDYKVQVDTYAPGMKPKSNPEDMAKIKELYSDLETRLKGISESLTNCKVEKAVIKIVKRGGIADDDDD